MPNQANHYENTPIQIYRHFHLQKLKIFRYKNSDIFHMSAQNIDCRYLLEPHRWGGSNDFPQSMFLSRNKKIIYTPVNPSFTIWKWGLRGSTLYIVMRRIVVLFHTSFAETCNFGLLNCVAEELLYRSVFHRTIHSWLGNRQLLYPLLIKKNANCITPLAFQNTELQYIASRGCVELLGPLNTRPYPLRLKTFSNVARTLLQLQVAKENNLST